MRNALGLDGHSSKQTDDRFAAWLAGDLYLSG